GGAVTGLAWLLLACGSRPPAPPVDPRPDVLLVVMDTVRQDRVGTYGYPRPTTPNVDALAVSGIRYAEARSVAPWTSPAHASLFTGLFPDEHRTTQESWTLAASHTTLAEHLAAAGYRTVAAVGNPMVSAKRGFLQGFETQGESFRPRVRREDQTPDAWSVAWLEEQLPARDGRPQLVFVNLIGAHSPYTSCGTFCGRFGARPGEGEDANAWQAVALGRKQHDATAFERFSNLYDAEVAAVDDAVGRIVSAFRAAAGDRRTLVIVTSDHGEHLGEHGQVDHVFSVGEPLVRVPLVVAGSGVAPAVSQAPVQLPDVFGTVLSAAGIAGTHATLDGVPADRPQWLAYYRPVQATRMLRRKAQSDAERARIDALQFRRFAVVEGGDKLVVEQREGARPQLFDLRRDPGEVHDLAETRPPRVVALTELLRADARPDEAPAAAAVDPETQAALEALGYLE
ncbi:MAG: sulfatase, partial [Myxococcota bacterium]